MKHTQTHKFKKGQKLHLDQIYEFQGIGDSTVGKWWMPDDGDCGDEITVTQDIKITITIEAPNAGNERTAE
jgi:hypothetical protein